MSPKLVQIYPHIQIFKAEPVNCSGIIIFEIDIQCKISRVSNIESDKSQNVGLEDYNSISVGIFP